VLVLAGSGGRGGGRREGTGTTGAAEKSKIWGRGEAADVALWDPRVGNENMEIAGANYVLRMNIVLLHPNNFI
jgi:hypothetical protein